MVWQRLIPINKTKLGNRLKKILKVHNSDQDSIEKYNLIEINNLCSEKHSVHLPINKGKINLWKLEVSNSGHQQQILKVIDL